MALEFTSIPDRTDAAVYLLGVRARTTKQSLIAFGNEVDALTSDKTQVVYPDPARADGLKVKEFYGLVTFPCVLIVMDDDTIFHQWSSHIPKLEEVAYALGQINGSLRG